MCKNNEESADHLLFHFEVACAIWNVFFKRFGLSWVMPRRVIDLFAWWIVGSTRSVIVWKMMPLCLLWSLWQERNDRCFEDHKRSLEELKYFFLNTLYLWTAAYVSPLVMNSLFFLPFLPRRLLLYTSCVHGAPYALMISQLLIKRRFLDMALPLTYIFKTNNETVFKKQNTFQKLPTPYRSTERGGGDLPPPSIEVVVAATCGGQPPTVFFFVFYFYVLKTLLIFTFQKYF
jgi:hypothetical protein